MFGPRASRPLMWSADLQVRIMIMSGPEGPRSEEHERAWRPAAL